MSFLLTVDDLRAMQRLVGVWLPAFTLDRDSCSVRGPLDLDEVTTFSEAFSDAVVAAEATIVKAGVTSEYAYSVSESGARGLMQALPRGLVQCRVLSDNPFAPWLSGLVRAEGPEWTVDSVLFDRCDDLVLTGALASAVSTLESAGIAPNTAIALATAMAGNGSAGVITVAHRCGTTGRLSAGELRWLAGEQGGAWRIGVGEGVHFVSPASGDELSTALAVLCEGGQPCQTP